MLEGNRMLISYCQYVSLYIIMLCSILIQSIAQGRVDHPQKGEPDNTAINLTWHRFCIEPMILATAKSALAMRTTITFKHWHSTSCKTRHKRWLRRCSLVSQVCQMQVLLRTLKIGLLGSFGVVVSGLFVLPTLAGDDLRMTLSEVMKVSSAHHSGSIQQKCSDVCLMGLLFLEGDLLIAMSETCILARISVGLCLHYIKLIQACVGCFGTRIRFQSPI